VTRSISHPQKRYCVAAWEAGRGLEINAYHSMQEALRILVTANVLVDLVARCELDPAPEVSRHWIVWARRAQRWPCRRAICGGATRPLSIACNCSPGRWIFSSPGTRGRAVGGLLRRSVAWCSAVRRQPWPGHFILDDGTPALDLKRRGPITQMKLDSSVLGVLRTPPRVAC